MPLEPADRAELMRKILTYEEQRMQGLLRAAPSTEDAYKLQIEPISALFADEASVLVNAIHDAYDPFQATVQSTVDITWNSNTLGMIESLDRAGVPFRALGRSGGVYHQFPNKRVGKWKSQFRYLIQDSMELWQRPWWNEYGKQLLVNLLDTYRVKTAENLRILQNHPERIIGDKPPGTGTGWKFPLDTRQAMADNLPRFIPDIMGICDQYYGDLMQAVDRWPDEGSIIHIGHMFRGIVGGTRSDVDVIEWNEDTQVLSAKSREVGNDPSSAFHNKVLDPVDWQKELWRKTITPYHFLPMEQDGYILSLTTPPATIPGDPDEIALVSADFGWCQQGARYDDASKRLILRNEGKSFGADNISLNGIVLYAAEERRWIPMIKSGTPYTMSHYLIIAGHALKDWAQRNGIGPEDLRVLQVGDDLQILMRRRYIAPLMADMGQYLRTKGMKVFESGYHVVFILGHYVAWKDSSHVIAFIEPRGLKSVSSAVRIRRGDTPDNVNRGQRYTLRVNAEAKEQASQLWKLYPKLILFEGTVDEYRTWLEQSFFKGKRELAQAGISEWFLDITDDKFVPNPMTAVFKVKPTPVPEQLSQEAVVVQDQEVAPKDGAESAEIEPMQYEAADETHRPAQGGASRCTLCNVETSLQRIKVNDLELKLCSECLERCGIVDVDRMTAEQVSCLQQQLAAERGGSDEEIGHAP